MDSQLNFPERTLSDGFTNHILTDNLSLRLVNVPVDATRTGPVWSNSVSPTSIAANTITILTAVAFGSAVACGRPRP